MQFPIKGTISDIDYNNLLQKVSKDKQNQPLSIGDKVAYAVCSRHASKVPIGTIIDIELGYYGIYISHNQYQPDMDLNKVQVRIKIKSECGVTIERLGSYIAKVC